MSDRHDRQAARAPYTPEEVEKLKQWKDRVIDALVVTWAYKAVHDDDPKLAVADLIESEIQMALDPMISQHMHDALKAAFEAGMHWTISWDRPVTQESVNRGFELHLKALAKRQEEK